VAKDEPPQPYEAPVEMTDKGKKKALQLQEMAIALDQDVTAAAKDLDKAQAQHFMTIYNNHNILRTVETVRESVSEGVKSCSRNNSDAADFTSKMQERFKEWDEKIGSAESDANAQIKNMIAAQDYMKRSKIRSILKQADVLRSATNKEFDKVPVESLAACKTLLGKMDATQERLYDLIGTTLVTLPAALEPNSEEAPQE